MRVFLVDLDNTLYPSDLGVFDLVDKRISEYMIKYLDMMPEEVPRKRIEYWHKYGTTMAGLMKHYGIDPYHFLEFTHDVDLSGKIKANPKLREKLKSLSAVKIVFTNAPLKHAQKVLEMLGVIDLFIDIFDIVSADFVGKPHRYPYQKIIKLTNAEKYLMADDMESNLRTAIELGIFTIHVGSNNGIGHLNVESFEKIPEDLINNL